LRSRFAALDDFDLIVVEAEDFIFIGDAATSDDALVGLFDGSGNLL